MEKTYLSNIEFKMLVNNINNIEIREYSKAKETFENIKTNHSDLSSYEPVKRENNYIILLGDELIGILSRDSIRAIINLRRDEARRKEMFKALQIDITKDIPYFSYMCIARKSKV